MALAAPSSPTRRRILGTTASNGTILTTYLASPFRRVGRADPGTLVSAAFAKPVNLVGELGAIGKRRRDRRVRGGYGGARRPLDIPPGHPEGYLEAFANLYREFATAIRAKEPLAPHVPSVEAGVRGVRFVEAVIESSERGGWVAV